MSKNKIKTTSALLLILTIMVTSIAISLPVTNAVSNEETWTYLSVEPNPCGVGQIVTVSMWIYPLPPTANMRYHNLSCTVTKPDGSTATLGPVTGGPLGNAYWSYVPATTGTYHFVAHFSGDTFLNVPPPYVPAGDVIRLSSDSEDVALTVQQEQIEPWPDTPLPTEYLRNLNISPENG